MTREWLAIEAAAVEGLSTWGYCMRSLRVSSPRQSLRRSVHSCLTHGDFGCRRFPSFFSAVLCKTLHNRGIPTKQVMRAFSTKAGIMTGLHRFPPPPHSFPPPRHHGVIHLVYDCPSPLRRTSPCYRPYHPHPWSPTALARTNKVPLEEYEEAGKPYLHASSYHEHRFYSRQWRFPIPRFQDA